MSIYPSEILSRNLSIQLNYYQAGFWDQEWNLQQYKKCSITNSWSALTGEMKVPTFTEGLWLPVSQSNEVSEQLSVLLRLFLSNKYLILHRVEFKHTIWARCLYLYGHQTLKEVQGSVFTPHSSPSVKLVGKTQPLIVLLAQREDEAYWKLRSNVVVSEKDWSYHHAIILFVQTFWLPVNNSLEKNQQKGFS